MKALALLALVALAAPLAGPADTDSIGIVVQAVYDAISGPGGRPRLGALPRAIRRGRPPDFDARDGGRDRRRW